VYTYEFKPSAFKDLKKLPTGVRKKIIKKLDYFVESGKPLRFADFLIDHRLGDYRFRVGDYRIIFDVEGERLIILAVGHRKSVYR
jgi:mRNA interferase RelE/StbE